MKYTITKPESYKKIGLPGLTKWVAALRSGKYSQGYRALCRMTPTGVAEYCCLGVLSSVQGRLKFLSEERMADMTTEDSDVWGMNALCIDNPLNDIIGGLGQFPKEIYIYSSEPYMDYTTLAYINDSKKFTFNDIADILEELYHEPEDNQVSKTDS